MGKINKGKSFGLTIRPRYGLKDRLLYNILTWVEKNSKHLYCIAEKEGSERHCHIQMWIQKEKSKGDIKKQLDRFAETDYKEEKVEWTVDDKKFCNKVRFCYNDWVEEYCNENELKNDEYDVILDKRPITYDEEQSYYPSEEEQDKIKNKKNAKDQYLMELELMYLDDSKGEIPAHRMQVAMWLDTQCYEKRTLKASMMHRNRVELKNNLFNYLTKKNNGYGHSTKEDIKEYEEYQKSMEIYKNLQEEIKDSSEIEDSSENWNSD